MNCDDDKDDSEDDGDGEEKRKVRINMTERLEKQRLYYRKFSEICSQHRALGLHSQLPQVFVFRKCVAI